MGTRVPWGLLFLVAVGCGTADNRVDPGDLELRDLLGIAPQPASRWSGEQRAAARRVIAASLDDEVPERWVASEPLAPFRDEIARDAVVIQALARWDDRIAGEGLPARALLRVAAPPGMMRATIRATARASAAVSGAPAGSAGSAAATGDDDVSLQLAAGWNDEPLIELTSRGAAELTALARDAGHTSGPVVAVPAGRLAVLAAYLESSGGAATPRLLVNPVLLAALEPGSGEPLGSVGGTSAEGDDGSSGTDRHGAGGGTDGGAAGGAKAASGAAGSGGASAAPSGPGAMAVGGNPYSFYGSVAECAYAQRLRCEACLPGGTCEPLTNLSDGNAECEMLGAGGGRGYFLECINLSLAISSVDECTADRAPTCPRDRDAASSLAELESNARFLDEDGCKVGLDGCLAKIYGAPDTEYPGPGGGDSPAPPRDINVDCDNSCDDSSNNGNCESSPSCETSGPSCNNSLSCDSTCSNSNDQSGCNGNCNSCNSENSGGGESGCGGECSDSDGGGGGGSSDSGCSSDDSGGDGGGCGGDSGNSNDGCGGDGCGGGSSSGGDSCGGGGSGDSGCGGGSGGGGCGGGSGGSSGCGGGGGGSSNKCSVTPSAPPSKGGRVPASMSFLMMAIWGLAPIPAAAFARRRALRKSRSAAPLSGSETGETSETSEMSDAAGEAAEMSDDTGDDRDDDDEPRDASDQGGAR